MEKKKKKRREETKRWRDRSDKSPAVIFSHGRRSEHREVLFNSHVRGTPRLHRVTRCTGSDYTCLGILVILNRVGPCHPAAATSKTTWATGLYGARVLLDQTPTDSCLSGRQDLLFYDSQQFSAPSVFEILLSISSRNLLRFYATFLLFS